MSVVRLLLGALLLTVGRRLFWFFIAAIGFVAGLRFSAEIMVDLPAWLGILIGLLIGLGAAGLAVLFQQFAIGLAGFLAGAYVLLSVLELFGLDGSTWTVVALLVGGIGGALIMYTIFDWALIVLSSIAGANLIMDAVQPDSAATLWFLLLIGGGVLIQAAGRRREGIAPAD